MLTRRQQTAAFACLAALFVFFLYAVFMVMDKREHLRATQQQKAQSREQQIVLEDELRNLQLEYATRTGYGHLHAAARQLTMQMPRPGNGTFLYLPQPSQLQPSQLQPQSVQPQPKQETQQ